MPQIKRWFPVSHDINADPEIWELTDQFGVTGLRAWLEILSIADRNEGVLPGLWESYPRLLAGRCQSTSRYLVGVCQFASRWLLVDSQGIARVVNYRKYHRSREPNSLPPDLPDLPNHPEENLKKDSLVGKAADAPALLDLETEDDPDKFHVQDLVDSWNDVFGSILPKVEWPLAPSRHRKASMRVKEHQSLDFWQKVFDQIGGSDFLTGKGNGSWKCTFDFLINNDTNALKIWEGAYANGKKDFRPGFNRWQGRR